MKHKSEDYKISAVINKIYINKIYIIFTNKYKN